MRPQTYLDHAATTPVLPEAIAAFAEEAARLGNPSSTHGHGRAARASLETSRERIAAALDADPAEVLFTAGGSEADTLAVTGAYLARAEANRTRVAISAVEHAAVIEAAHDLARRHGAAVVKLPVDGAGVLRLDALGAELDAHADALALVSVMWANNEVGALQPVDGVVAAVRAACGGAVAVHSDAVQAVGHVPVTFVGSGLDALTLSGHKLGAPAGIGALLARRSLALAPVIAGGGQERGVRSGTVPVALAAALAVAVETAVRDVDGERRRLGALRDRLAAGALAAVLDARLDGPDGDARLPGHVHLTIPGVDVDALLFGLDSAGVSASAGSACHAGVTQASHVMLAMGASPADARSVLRLTLGRTSTDADVDAVLAVLPGAAERARAAGLVAARARGPAPTPRRSG
ncbi:aminotransferase class V [Beutenbergia cavernae DSM 12333]|uniref:cysteine desulfurase n=1 Tax=Beutenbergia cavernae (strain ATCC BAA-8 / DSM 12333 / CCUG 43141 / JCM 11478 / NBRC 16432 / NCIMB 13614 / HKI 0122) TaxID=471853 RepID=C5C2D4_BEUC1|nr:cysteine desulfurase family protein [Beutenbergia cavernae]ACQ79620.1 aminotransferase class V [Beutenbergia cavernae DSM 12333]